MTKTSPLVDRSSVALAAWERPAMVRLDAADAEFMTGAGGDSTSAMMSMGAGS